MNTPPDYYALLGVSPNASTDDIKIAQNMNYPIVKQYMSLGDDDYVIAISPPSSWHGVAWHDLNGKIQ